MTATTRTTTCTYCDQPASRHVTADGYGPNGWSTANPERQPVCADCRQRGKGSIWLDTGTSLPPGASGPTPDGRYSLPPGWRRRDDGRFEAAWRYSWPALHP